MNLHIIKNEKEYQNLLGWVEKQFDLQVKPELETGKDLQFSSLLIKQYEDEKHPIPTLRH